MSNYTESNNRRFPASRNYSKSWIRREKTHNRSAGSKNVVVAVRVRPPFEHEVSEEESDAVAVVTFEHENRIFLLEPNVSRFIDSMVHI